MAYTAWSVSQDEVPDAAKWNLLGSNDAHFYDFLGDDLEWQSWTPTHTYTTVGNGTEEAKYIQIGKTVFFRYKIQKQSTTTIGTALDFSFPVAPKQTYLDYFYFLGPGYAEDYLSVGYVASCGSEPSANTIVVQYGTTTTVYVARASFSGTLPFTGGINDYYTCSGFYEAE